MNRLASPCMHLKSSTRGFLRLLLFGFADGGPQRFEVRVVCWFVSIQLTGLSEAFFLFENTTHAEIKGFSSVCCACLTTSRLLRTSVEEVIGTGLMKKCIHPDTLQS